MKRDTLDALLTGRGPWSRRGSGARLLIDGQAPSVQVHRSGVPWDDRRGDRLRTWLGIDRARSYDAAQESGHAIIVASDQEPRRCLNRD